MDVCINDLNCSAMEVCYREVSWLPSGVVSLCGCNAFWGWGNPPECDEFGASTYFLIVTSVINMLIGLYALGLALWDGRTFWLYPGSTLDLKLCFAFTALAMLFVVLWNILTLANASSAQVTSTLTLEAIIGEFRREDPTEQKFAPYEDIEGFFSYLAPVFSILSYSNISLLWWDAVRNAQSMRPFRQFDSLHWAVRVYQVGFIIVLVPLIILQEIIAGIIVVISAQTTVFLAYAIGLWKFLGLLNAGDENGKYDDLVRTLRNNALVVTFFIFIQTAMSIGYLTYQALGWKEGGPIGVISPYVVIRQVTFFAGTVALLAIYFYVHGIIKGRAERMDSVKREVLEQPKEGDYTLATQTSRPFEHQDTEYMLYSKQDQQRLKTFLYTSETFMVYLQMQTYCTLAPPTLVELQMCVVFNATASN